MAETKMRHVRSGVEWDRAAKAAKAAGTNMSEVVRGLLVDYAEGNLPGYTSGFVAGVEAGKAEASRQTAETVRTAAEKALAAVVSATDQG